MGGYGSFAIFPQNRFRLVPGSALLAFARQLGVIPYSATRLHDIPSASRVFRLVSEGSRDVEKLFDALDLFDDVVFESVEGEPHAPPPDWPLLEGELADAENWMLSSFRGTFPERVQADVESIPEEIRGSFAPGDLVFSHGLRVYANYDRGDLQDVVACTASVSISGQGWLKDYMGMWRAMEALPAVVELRERLRPLFGETGVILEWSC